MALYCLRMFILVCLLETSYSLTIKLIHRDSPESPLYQPNLTSAERVKRLVMQTKSRGFGGSNSSSGTLSQNPLQSKLIRPHLDIVVNTIYVAKFGIGTFPNRPSFKNYYLQVDTGSELMWIQCEDCKIPEHHCFTQTVPVFRNSRSQTYSPLLCNQHELCYPNECIEDRCSYDVLYFDQTRSIGYLAQEKFTITSSTPPLPEKVQLVFGCGIYNIAPPFEALENNKIAGVLGLGWGPRSFVQQIGSQSQGKFSYCLQSFNYWTTEHPPSTYLRFGSDIQVPSDTHLHTTTLQEYQDDAAYYVNLLGISINNNRLQIPRRYFSKTRQGGGCMIDSGTSYSKIARPAFDILKQAIESYVARVERSLTRIDEVYGFDLCFQRNSPPEGFRNLPHITFHFQGGADLQVPPQSAFYAEVEDSSENICLAMVPTSGNDASIIGSYSQTNNLFVYDTWGRQLSFGYQDCSENP